jgi:hypothetical protein
MYKFVHWTSCFVSGSRRGKRGMWHKLEDYWNTALCLVVPASRSWSWGWFFHTEFSHSVFASLHFGAHFYIYISSGMYKYTCFLFQHHDGRCAAIWSSLHRTLLHFYCHMGKPVLLYVWFSFPGVYHPCDIVLSDFNSDGIFPVMWRGEFVM